MMSPVPRVWKVGRMGGLSGTGFPSLTSLPSPERAGVFFPRALARAPRMMATILPCTVAGAIRVSTTPASMPVAWAYMADSGTAPAVMPPLVMGMAM